MPNVNVQHLVAMLLIDGRLTFDSVHDEARMRSEDVLALRRRIRLHPSDELMTAIPRRQAIVEVTMHDGRQLSRRTRAVRGTADNPMSREEVEEKARDLIAKSLGATVAARLVDAVRRLETLADMNELSALWRDAPAARRSAS
jgi:2-methylcitrate dehydratase PrpD